MSVLIIAIKNKASKGKTSTIKLVAEKLYQKYLNQKKKFNSEIFEIIDVIINNKQVRIAVISQGDPSTGLKKKLLDKINEKSNVIICATRTSGETVNAVNDILINNIDSKIIWTTSYETNDENLFKKMNDLKSTHIIELLESLY